jgi:hypothetical protein
MYLFETKKFLNVEEELTLVISNDKAVIQELYHDDAVLCETAVDYFHKEESAEISVVLTEKVLKLFKLFKIFSIDSTNIYFGDMSLKYFKGEFQMLESTEPMKLSCIIHVDESFTIDDDCTTCNLYVDDNFNLELDNNIIYHKKTFRTFRTSSKQKFNFEILLQIFNDHKDQMCKVYTEYDRPLCLEFLGDTTTRYHVAPMYED